MPPTKENLPERALCRDFGFTIVKATYDERTGKHKFLAVASDTQPDSYQEAMSLELFRDFIRRVDTQEPPPDVFCSAYWKGGMPYISISHYPDLNGAGAAGVVKELFVDGDRLKAKGEFFDTPLGNAAFQAVSRSIVGDPPEKRVRISIAFLDWKHKHGNFLFTRSGLTDRCPMCVENAGDKVYLGGHLVHLALTRVPVNTRTAIEAMEVKSMTTRKEDAASIVGEELAAELDKEASLVGKSEALIVKGKEDDETDDTPEEECLEEDGKCKKKKMQKKSEAGEEVAKNDVPGGDMPIGANAYALEMPFGGAITFDEAKKWITTQEKVQHFQDAWSTFQTLSYNILTRGDIADKQSAIHTLVKEFQGQLEVKALVGLGQIDELLAQREVIQKSAVQPHPLDPEVEALKRVFTDTVSNELPPQEKLRVIQETYATLGEAIVRSVGTLASQAAPAQEAEAPVADTLVASLKSALAEALQPLNDTMRLIVAQQSAAVSVPSTRKDVTVPQPRQLPPQPAMAPASASATPKLRAIINKSVGMH